MMVSPLTTQGEGIARMSGQTSFVQQAPVHPETSARFGDLHPPLDRQAAIPEANRCLYCFDAPCTTACPTHIDVPRFIKKIASGNLAGSARTILDANILGASCARACPVEVLVRRRLRDAPLQQAAYSNRTAAAVRHGFAARERCPACPLRRQQIPVYRWRSSAPARPRLPALPNCGDAASGPSSTTRVRCPGA